MQRSKTYVFAFALALCLCVSVGLAITVTALRSDQILSARIDVIQNILLVAGYTPQEIQSLSAQEPRKIIDVFSRQFQARVIDKNDREVELNWIRQELQVLGFPPQELESREAFELIDIFRSRLELLAQRAGKSLAVYDPGLNLIFLYRPQKEVVSYIVPVEGYGLWDMIYGYIALEPDINTIKDIRFYKHQETPGLGGECSQPWFMDQFKGKKILDSQGNFVSVAVVKGKAAELYSGEDLAHYVDGISGGTITSKGITQFLREDLGRYNKYFETLHKKENKHE